MIWSREIEVWVDWESKPVQATGSNESQIGNLITQVYEK